MHTKWRLGHPETPVELSVSLLDSLASLFVAKDQAQLVLESIGVNYSLQPNQFVRRPIYEEEKEAEDEV